MPVLWKVGPPPLQMPNEDVGPTQEEDEGGVGREPARRNWKHARISRRRRK